MREKVPTKMAAVAQSAPKQEPIDGYDALIVGGGISGMYQLYRLRELGMKESVLATVNDLVFAILFLVCRLVIGTPLVWRTVTCETNAYIVKAGGLGILIVSLMWGWRIVMMIVRTSKALLFGKKTKKA